MQALFKIISFVFFFGILTPLGLLLRGLGIDLMDLRFRKGRPSFFKPVKRGHSIKKSKLEIRRHRKGQPPDKVMAPDTVYPLW